MRGIGPWTVAEVAQRALGDADAVSVGDFHLPKQVVYAFTGGMHGTDEEMLALLEPFAGHRFRVQRLVELSDVVAPGPRPAHDDRRPPAIADQRRRCRARHCGGSCQPSPCGMSVPTSPQRRHSS